MMVIPSYVARGRPRQERGPAFQAWYSGEGGGLAWECLRCARLGRLRKDGAAMRVGLTEGTKRYALAILLEPSVGVEDGGVFSPDLRHACHYVVLVANYVASVGMSVSIMKTKAGCNVGRGVLTS